MTAETVLETDDDPTNLLDLDAENGIEIEEAVAGRPRVRSLLRSVGTVAVGALLVGLALVAWQRFTGGPVEPSRVAESQLITEEEFVAATGAELVYLSETGGGGMIDIRYRVLDTEMALVFHDEALPIALYDPDDGTYLVRPFHEHSHDVELHQAVVYHELLVNLGSAFHRGDTVTLLVGPYRLDNVPIQ